VRGNGKIIQELEGNFRGAGWNVIKVVWGSGWDPLLAADKSGLLLKRMEECVDGEYQDFKSKNGAYVREHFFGKYPELLDLVKDMTDDQIWALSRGGHDPSKVYAAYKAAVDNVDTPTVILAKTVKGYGMGEAGEGQNITHQQKKMGENVLRAFRDRFKIVTCPDEKIPEVPFLKLKEGSPEQAYLQERRAGPRRSAAGTADALDRDPADPRAVGVRRAAQAHRRSHDLDDDGVRPDPHHAAAGQADRQARGPDRPGRVADRSAWKGLFRQFGIWSQVGQLYRPEDANQLMYYKEDKSGQMLQEGINEAGAMSSWIAAATSYSVSDTPMIPFYVYYSMFGFQRIGDLAWAAGDSRARGFLIGGTAGRTTLNGEGLQHEDGHSHLISATIPNCVSYDPTYVTRSR
jgi:pyruvate dehydrogenase E1 component